MRFALAFLLLPFAAGFAFAQEKSWKGESVLYIKWPRDIRFGDRIDGKEVYFEFSGITPITVRDDREGLLRVHDGRREGWVGKADFILVNEASDFFHGRVVANPKDTFALYMRGEGWLRKGEWDNAIKDFTECIRLDPNIKEGYNSRGIAWKGKKDYEKAVADYNEAIRLDPKYVNAYICRGNAWSAKKDYEKAIADYKEAIRLAPNYALPYRNRGHVWSAKKDYDKALADYNEAIRLDPNYAAAYNNRGNTWSAKKNYDKAITDYNEAIRLDPKNSGVLNSLAWLLATCPDAKARDGKKAVECALKGAEIDKSADMMDTVAAAYAEAGNFEEAIRWQERAVEADNTEELRRRLELYRKKQPYRQE